MRGFLKTIGRISGVVATSADGSSVKARKSRLGAVAVAALALVIAVLEAYGVDTGVLTAILAAL